MGLGRRLNWQGGGESLGAARQNFGFDHLNLLFEIMQMYRVDLLASWQAHCHRVDLTVVDQNFIMQMRPG